MKFICIPDSPLTVSRYDFAGSHEDLELNDFPVIPSSASLGIEIIHNNEKSDVICCALSLLSNSINVLSQYDRLKMEFRKNDIQKFINDARYDNNVLIRSDIGEHYSHIYELFDINCNGYIWIDEENGIELGVSFDKSLFDEFFTWDIDDIDFSFNISNQILYQFLYELEDVTL